MQDLGFEGIVNELDVSWDFSWVFHPWPSRPLIDCEPSLSEPCAGFITR